jgi:hypothetical protein
MRARYLLGLCVLVTLGLAVTTWAYPGIFECSVCKETACPNGTVVVESDGNADGCYISWWGLGSCAGDCYACTGSSATGWCKKVRVNSLCIVDSDTINCGTRTYYNDGCTGKKKPCSCNTKGTPTPSSDACILNHCTMTVE